MNIQKNASNTLKGTKPTWSGSGKKMMMLDATLDMNFSLQGEKYVGDPLLLYITLFDL